MAGQQVRDDVRIRQLQGALGGNRLSEPRVASGTFAAGVSTVAIDASGIASVVGCIIIRADPAAHWSFDAFPRAADIVVRNDGASQDIAFTYLVVGAR